MSGNPQMGSYSQMGITGHPTAFLTIGGGNSFGGGGGGGSGFGGGGLGNSGFGNSFGGGGFGGGPDTIFRKGYEMLFIFTTVRLGRKASR